ncbi:hypothetical protein NLG97_g2400 [Lecanicillium saksenae]|uniref:Uncharacterized protein n=1 Tax=Lecanicillium saksenae TaxID=468837 RepID=A0ACC1R0Z1_9HYPO|nr:hypothetical protein NLG97_g2400 [Lecanicillium saksenae]
MRVSVRLLGRTSSEGADTNALRSCMENCDIWERLNLRARYCGTTDNRELEFSLQHPDLSASLICPPTVAKLELRDIRCQIEVTRISATGGTKKRKRSSPDEVREEMSPHTRTEHSLHADLSAHDRTAVHDFITGLTGMGNSVPDEALERLLRAAMAALITGSTRHYSDVSIKQGSTATALVRLMPAVFNVAYIGTISDRVQHTPVITSALASLHNIAQSPALKRKTGYLAEQESIERKLWESIVSTIKPPSVPGPRMVAANPVRQEAGAADAVDHGLGVGIISFAEGLLSPDASSDLSSCVEIFSSQQSLPTVQIDQCVFDEVLPTLECHTIDCDAQNFVEFGSGALSPTYIL